MDAWGIQSKVLLMFPEDLEQKRKRSRVTRVVIT